MRRSNIKGRKSEVDGPNSTMARLIAATAHGFSALKTASSTIPISESWTMHLRKAYESEPNILLLASGEATHRPAAIRSELAMPRPRNQEATASPTTRESAMHTLGQPTPAGLPGASAKNMIEGGKSPTSDWCAVVAFWWTKQREVSGPFPSSEDNIYINQQVKCFSPPHCSALCFGGPPPIFVGKVRLSSSRRAPVLLL